MRQMLSLTGPSTSWSNPATGSSAKAISFAVRANTPLEDAVGRRMGAGLLPDRWAGAANGDGGNRVVFNDPFDEITDPTNCGGVLAVGGDLSPAQVADQYLHILLDGIATDPHA